MLKKTLLIFIWLIKVLSFKLVIQLFQNVEFFFISIFTFILLYFSFNVPFLYSLQTSETKVFVTFSGGTKVEQAKNGYKRIN